MRFAALALLLASPVAFAQQVTAADYARARRMLQPATDRLMDDRVDNVHWTSVYDLAWESTTAGKTSLHVYNTATGKTRVETTRDETTREKDEDPFRSPDGSTTLFIKDWNLWARDVRTGRERALTTDGAPDYGYATDNAGWQRSNHPVMVWSPDSKRIATFRQDQRRDGTMTLVATSVGHPRTETWKYPLPGDKDVTKIERVIVDARTGAITKLAMQPDEHRGTQCDDLHCGEAGWDDVRWSPDASQIVFVSTSRDHKRETVRIADAATGNVRDVFTETSETYLESGVDHTNWQYLWSRNALLWYSERSGWAQLYLYDGKNLKTVTHGDGAVTEMVHVDEQRGTLLFTAVGKEHDRDPYYEQLYSVKLDGSEQALLTQENASHTITLSPDATHIADVYSTPTEPPTLVVRDTAGHVQATLAHTRIDRLQGAGWVPPVPFTVKAHDGKTDLYGLLFKPSRFYTEGDAAKKYPVIDFIYPGPQTGSVGSRSFVASRRDCQALAELGFIVVAVDAMGTPNRSRAFHEAYYGRLRENAMEDQVTTLKQLAAQNAWMDLSRAGIWGHSGGGYATVSAMLLYPDFFKVGVAESGNHDNRSYEDDWGERWIGLDDGKKYAAQANWPMARNLRGHLLLMHGTMDDNVPPNNTLLLADALIKANKDFDLLLIPNAHHAYGEAAGYAMRRRWDYFVRYLQGAEPPPAAAWRSPGDEE